MPNTTQIPTADEIADMAERGEEISQYFTNQGVMKYPTLAPAERYVCSNRKPQHRKT
jgi:hypothetical protein